MKIPLYGWFSRKFGMIPIQRETGPGALRDMLKEARARAAAGRQILVFPEGTRRKPGAPPAYKPGILLLYDALKLPCVPVALNSGYFWPRDSLLRRPGTIVVEILPAIPPGLKRKAFEAELVGRIEDASARLLREAQKPGSSSIDTVTQAVTEK
jgi:1-acyl-sn-glycerol-3-phosphate acyltransferase